MKKLIILSIAMVAMSACTGHKSYEVTDLDSTHVDTIADTVVVDSIVNDSL